MDEEANEQPFDPYQPLEQSLKTGDAINRWLLQRPRQKIVELLQGQRVLDVCCGTGSLTAMLAVAGCQVVGVDRSPTMLSFARGKSIAAEFKLMDAAQLPFHSEFDAAVISLALHEMPPPVRERVWKSMREALLPAGRLVVLDYAAPARGGLAARFARSLIERDERSLLTIDPAHYQNFQEFMRSGGLLAWVQKHAQPPDVEYRFWAGTVAVIVTR